MRITSPQNPAVREYARLLKNRRYRRRAGKIALEGPNLVAEAIEVGLEPEVVFTTEEYKAGGGCRLISRLPEGVKLAVLPGKLFARLADTEAPQQIAAIFYYRETDSGRAAQKGPDPVLILDRLQDPGNLGTLIRTAAAAGIRGVYLIMGGADPFSPKALRSSAGAVFQIRLEEVEDPAKLLRELKKEGLQVIGTAAGAPLVYWEVDYRQPTAVVIGNEAGGINPELLSAVDYSVAIPLSGRVESLNAAAAGAVIMYEIMRQRRV